MKEIIKSFLIESARIKTELAADDSFIENFDKAADSLKKTVVNGGTIYACGNGGSACDAMHFTEELVARYKRDREGIKAMHFMDPGTLTCWANDYDFQTVYGRQAKTFCDANDCLIAISTSGNSKNIIQAIENAKAKGTTTILLTGKGGGKAKSIADISIIVPSDETDRIQEAHICIIHALCEFLET